MLAVEEHDVNIIFCSPTAMTAITGPVRRPDHRFSIQHPFGVVVGVAAFGQVGHFAAAVRFHQNDVRIVPSSDRDIFSEEPFAVG